MFIRLTVTVNHERMRWPRFPHGSMPTATRRKVFEMSGDDGNGREREFTAERKETVAPFNDMSI